MSKRKLNECPACLRYPCVCSGGDDSVVEKKKDLDIISEQKKPNLSIVSQQPLSLEDKLLKQLADSFRVMVNSRTILFPSVSLNLLDAKKQNKDDDTLSADKENNAESNCENTSSADAGPGM